MTALLMQLNDQIGKGSKNVVLKQRAIADEQIAYIIMYGLPDAVLKQRTEGNTLHHGFAALRTTDGGLTFSVDKDTTGQLHTHYTLDSLLSSLHPGNSEQALFNHYKLFQHSHNSISSQLKSMFELKSQYPDLNGFEIYALNQKLKEDPALKDNRENILELIAGIKQGSVADELRHYQGGKPSLRR